MDLEETYFISTAPHEGRLTMLKVLPKLRHLLVVFVCLTACDTPERPRGIAQPLPGRALEVLKAAQEQLPWVSRNPLVVIVP